MTDATLCSIPLDMLEVFQKPENQTTHSYSVFATGQIFSFWNI